tara:strand:+ start:1182 stop:2084 length:903 start_codon:yes stop_codon:yes gene_type:complete
LTAPLTAGWSGLTVSGGNLDSTTYGQGTSFPSTWNTSRLFWRTDTHKLYKNTGSTASPSWTELTLAGESITSGTVAAARIDNLDTSKLTSGTLGTARGGTGGTLPVANGGTGVTSFTANNMLISNGSGTALDHKPLPSLGTATQVDVGSTPSGSSAGEADLGVGNAYVALITFPTTARQFRVDSIIARFTGLTASGIIADPYSNRAISVTTSQTGGGSYGNHTFSFGSGSIFQGGQSIRWGAMCMSSNVSGHRFSSGTTAGFNSGTTVTEFQSSYSNNLVGWSGSQSMAMQLKYTPMGEF